MNARMVQNDNFQRFLFLETVSFLLVLLNIILEKKSRL